jgi:hypothetical protein
MLLKYWDESFRATTNLSNSLPTKILNFSSPLNSCFMTNQSIVAYRPLTTLVGLIYVHSTPINSNSIQNSVFLGLATCTKALSKCLDVFGGRVYISRNVVFDETVLPFFQTQPECRYLPSCRDSSFTHHLTIFLQY